jgi:hypothetical protein
MPEQSWSAKRERQYDHIKEGLMDRGDSEDLAQEIAARTVNKERARSGEAKTSSRTSVEDISSGRRGGLRSHKGPGGRTRDQPFEDVQSSARARCRWLDRSAAADSRRTCTRYTCRARPRISMGMLFPDELPYRIECGGIADQNGHNESGAIARSLTWADRRPRLHG